MTVAKGEIPFRGLQERIKEMDDAFKGGLGVLAKEIEGILKKPGIKKGFELSREDLYGESEGDEDDSNPNVDLAEQAQQKMIKESGMEDDQDEFDPEKQDDEDEDDDEDEEDA